MRPSHSVWLMMALFVALLPGCESSADIVVVLQADPEVAARSNRVLFEVRTQEGEVALVETFNVEETPFPIRRVITPRGGDVSREVTVTTHSPLPGSFDHS